MDTIIGSGKDIRLHSNFDIRFNAERIFIGGESGGSEVEVDPLVRGEKLRLFLEELIGILEQFKVSGTVGGISGPPEPSTMANLLQIKNKVASPDFLSDIGFIETENR